MGYEETHIEDTETAVLRALAGGKPYVFIKADIPDGEAPITVEVACGNGVGSARDIQTILALTESQLPVS